MTKIKSGIKKLQENKMLTAAVLRVALGVIIGGALGFAYYKFIGCRTGACPITSNPWISTFYGALMGFLITFK